MAMQSTDTILDDLYDAWRNQDLDRFASYLPADFSHVILSEMSIPLAARGVASGHVRPPRLHHRRL